MRRYLLATLFVLAGLAFAFHAYLQFLDPFPVWGTVFLGASLIMFVLVVYLFRERSPASRQQD
jgi:hypothetical protein